jgi:hypothetical protein
MDPETTPWEPPGFAAWQSWHPAEAARRLAGLDIAWCVVGGWAIDLFVGHETRAHGDLEIAILRDDLTAVRLALDDLVFHLVRDGEVRRFAEGVERETDNHQNWPLDPDANEWRVDIMLEPGDAETWVYRRDEGLHAARSFMVGRTDDGIPYLRPHGVLLFKAKYLRPKDEADFDTCLPRLDGEQRTWLAERLDEFHPEHPWAARLT